MNSGPRSVRRRLVAAALFAGIAFFGLLAVQQHGTAPPAPIQDAAVIRPGSRDAWFIVRQDGRKIGYSHRQVQDTAPGFLYREYAQVRFNTMGRVQVLDVRTRARLNGDNSLAAFESTLASGGFSFHARGTVAQGRITVDMGERRVTLPVDKPVYLGEGLWAAAFSAGLEQGQAAAFSLFDPLTLGTRAVRVLFEGWEMITLPAGPVRARKFTATLMGVSQTAWLADDGKVLRERGLLGITIERATKALALAKDVPGEPADLARAVSVAPAGLLPNPPEALKRLEVRVTNLPAGVKDRLAMDGGRQKFSGDVLTIVREPLPDPDALFLDASFPHLDPGPIIASDHPEIRAAAGIAVAGARRPLEKAKNLVRWVYERLEKRPVLSVPTAVETLRQGAGDCNEHAVLLAALARAAEIPARVEVGLVYLEGRFYYHAWNSLFLGEWVTADALMNQMPTDVTHVRLVRGVGTAPVALLGVVDRIHLAIMPPSSQ